MASSAGQEERVTRGARVSDAPVVSVVVLVLDDTDLLTRCLDSIAATTTVEYEAIVVANGTPEPALETLRRRDDILLLRLKENVGFGKGCNLGAALARGSYIALLNDDTEVEPGWLEALLKTFEDLDGVGTAGSMVLFPDGRLQEAGAIMWRDGASERCGHGRPGTDREFTVLRDVDYTSACSVLIDKQAWEAVGGFDDRYFPAYYEDVDLCMRLRNLGYRTVFQPESRIRHHESASTAPRWRNFISDRNRQLFLERWSAELADHELPSEPNAIARAVERARTAAPAKQAARG